MSPWSVDVVCGRWTVVRGVRVVRVVRACVVGVRSYLVAALAPASWGLALPYPPAVVMDPEGRPHSLPQVQPKCYRQSGTGKAAQAKRHRQSGTEGSPEGTPKPSGDRAAL